MIFFSFSGNKIKRGVEFRSHKNWELRGEQSVLTLLLATVLYAGYKTKKKIIKIFNMNFNYLL